MSFIFPSFIGFQLVLTLAEAQFERGDQEFIKRLWRDVADIKIDLDRMINLMNSCSFHNDDNDMTMVN